MSTFVDRMLDFQAEVFPPTYEGVINWVSTTRPTPARDDVASHVQTLVDRGILGDADLRRLRAAGYAD